MSTHCRPSGGFQPCSVVQQRQRTTLKTGTAVCHGPEVQSWRDGHFVPRRISKAVLRASPRPPGLMCARRRSHVANEAKNVHCAPPLQRCECPPQPTVRRSDPTNMRTLRRQQRSRHTLGARALPARRGKHGEQCHFARPFAQAIWCGRHTLV